MNPPYRTPCSPTTPIKEKFSWGAFESKHSFIFYCGLYFLLCLFTFGSIHLIGIYKGKHTRNTALTWAMEHNGRLLSCDSSGEIYFCRVQIPTGTVRLLYGVRGGSMPFLITPEEVHD
jgi:hypothetical protein